MEKLKNNLLVGSLDISSVCGNAENCLSWLIILLDILAIFYLVFVSFYKVTKLVRMIGWIWVGVLVTADVIIVAIHPCILTLLCILFTIMIMTAILSIVLPNVGYESKSESEQEGTTEKPERKIKSGSFVIREINEKKYCFELYDKQNRFLVRSHNCYKSVDDVKEAIKITRQNGKIAEVEDRTLNWIKEVNHPKFEIYKEKELYYYKLSADNKTLLFKSDAFELLQECKKQLNRAIASVKSYEIYISIEKLAESEAKQYNNMKSISYINENVEREEQPIQEQSAKEVSKVDESAVVINTGEKKTLWQSYSELSKEQKGFFDGLRKAAQEKEGSREFESSSQLAYFIFKDKLMRIQIKRNMVEAIFMLMDSSFKQIQNDNDIKIKETKTVLRIENEAYYSLAIETLNKKYDLVLEQKAERENQRKLDRLEKSRQKRLEKQGKNSNKN